MTTVLTPVDGEPVAADLPLDSASPADAGVRRPWIGFAVVLTAVVLNILDSTIVNVAAPSVARDLGLSTSALEWVAAAYTLALAVGLMTGGRLGDMLGRRRMLLIGLTGFVDRVGRVRRRADGRGADRLRGSCRA